ARFLPVGTKDAKLIRAVETPTIFRTYSLGISTNRDNIVYDFDQQKLAGRIEQFIEEYNAEVSRWVRAGLPKDIDSFVRYDKIKWSRNLKRDLRNEHYTQFNRRSLRRSLYRP